MKLVAFSVQDYRSITKTHKLPIKGLTLLIGPNNEGKSNILKALVVALRIIRQWGKVGINRGRFRRSRFHLDDFDYDWERDYPISLQGKKPDGKSSFNLEFELSQPEITEFKKEIGSFLSGSLPIQITIGGKNDLVFKIKKPGPGAVSLSKKAELITQFVGKRLEFEYIPAIRTANSAIEIVEEMVARELATVEEDVAYRKALNEIERIQTPILEKISKGIKETLSEFLPAVKDVMIKISEERRYKALRYSCEVTVDDGTPTLLQYKGDGVQSLSVLSLMRRVSERGASGKQLILAIEEPESHLHPHAIHQLRRVLQEMAGEHQVIMTSHNPLFVDRQDIKSNIIVTENKAAPAKDISQVRKILGVRASDNLRNAELVLVVEGEDDRVALSALLSHTSDKLKEALGSGKLAIDSLLGGSNLAYKLSQIRDVLCDSHSFLDHDKCGLEAAKKAQTEGVLLPADVTYTICNGMAEAEIEDMYDANLYKDMIFHRYNVQLTHSKFKSNKKWSDRLKETFKVHGQHWDDNVEKKVKAEVADVISSNPGNALNLHKRTAFDALVDVLEKKIAKS